MAMSLRLVNPENKYPYEYSGKDGIEPGDIWYIPVEDYPPGKFGAYYETNLRGKRDPLMAMFPSGDVFCIDGRSFDGERFGPGWSVTGDVPNISATPSFNFEGRYHGYIQNGMITDDLEQRDYKKDDRHMRVVGKDSI